MALDYLLFMFKGKRGSIVVALVVVIALVIIVGQIFSMAGRECSENSDCNEENYCGSDFECHPYPNITKYNLVPAATILALGIIIGAYLLRRKRSEEDVH